MVLWGFSGFHRGTSVVFHGLFLFFSALFSLPKKTKKAKKIFFFTREID